MRVRQTFLNKFDMWTSFAEFLAFAEQDQELKRLVVNNQSNNLQVRKLDHDALDGILPA